MNEPSVPQPSVTAPNLQPRTYRILMVIPTLGVRLDTLARTLLSITEQKGVSVDVVVVAQTISPSLVSIANRFGTRIITHPGNISEAVNAGFAEASEEHKYAGWLGDDDMLRPDALRHASALLEENPRAVVAYGACDYVDLDGNLLFSRSPPAMAPALLQFVPGLIKQEACLFRLSTLLHVGGLDKKLRYTMDLDLLLKMRHRGEFIRTDKTLAAFCWHPGSLTVANRKASLAEAQDVQRRHARGITKLLQPIWKHPFRYLILAANWKINRDLGNGSRI